MTCAGDISIKHNELTAVQFIELWKSVWKNAPAIEQVEVAMKNTIFRVSAYDGEKVIGMARMIGDIGLNYYIKDVIVRPEYQHNGIGQMLIDNLFRFINENGIKGTGVFVELCAAPDKIPFYQKFGFDYDEGKRLKKMVYIEGKQI